MFFCIPTKNKNTLKAKKKDLALFPSQLVVVVFSKIDTLFNFFSLGRGIHLFSSPTAAAAAALSGGSGVLPI